MDGHIDYTLLSSHHQPPQSALADLDRDRQGAVRYRRNGGGRLPPWLLHGLAAYIADMGPHYLNYMNYLIANGQGPALKPAEVDALLGQESVPFSETYDVDAAGNWEGHVILNRRRRRRR